MDQVYRGLVIICMILGLNIHLPVTMFPATEVEEFSEEGSVLHQSNKLQELEQQTRSEKSHIKGQDKVNFNSIIGSDYGKSQGIKLNNLQTFLLSRDVKGFKSLSESDPIQQVGKDPHLRLKNDFINGRIKQTEEKLANMSNIFTKNKKHLATDRRTKHSQIYINQKKVEQNKVLTENATDNVNGKIKQTDPLTSKYSILPDRSNDRNTYMIDSAANWPSELVKLCTKPFSQSDQDIWQHKVQNYAIVKLEDGCGSMQNRLVTFNDSTKACVRYRFNTDLIQGEIYSYYLSRILNIGHTVPTTLHKLENYKQWSKVQTEISEAKWSDSKPLIFTKWVDKLEPAFMPSVMRQLDVGLYGNNGLFRDKTVSELCDLVQWSDLIVFDYISANPDRVVNNIFNLKWNDKMMDKPIHNLEKSSKNGALVFLDNESGLFHGYRLLDTHHQFHRKLLESVCLYNPNTVKIIEDIYKGGNIGSRLVDAFVAGEKHQNMLPRISVKNLNILQSRLEDVYKHIQFCKVRHHNEIMSA